MEFPGEIVANIIEQRLSLCESDLDEESKNVAIIQANHILGFGLTIAVNFYLTHTNCKNRECDHNIPFEVWTLCRQKNDETNTPLLPLFLKQAIRSQLHFSPINSWLAQNGQKMPEGIKCSYRISTNPNLQNKIPNGIVEVHKFPICKFEPMDATLGEFLEVEVEWIRAKEMPIIDSIKKKDNENESIWIDTPTDGIPPSSTEEEDGSSSTPSSPSFPPSPPGEIVSEERRLISTERELDMMKDFLVNSDGKKKKIKKKNSNNDESEDEEKEEKSRFRRPRRCKTTSTSSSEITVRSRNSRSFCGTSLNCDNVVFNPKTRLPLNSSPAPLKRTPLVQNLAAKLRDKITVLDGDSSSSDSEYVAHKNSTIYGSQHSNNALLCNFEESALNGRLEPISTVEGFRLQLAVSGSFSVPHTMLPVSTYFFDVSDDNAPSLYLGHCSFKDAFGRKAIHIPKKCIVQATLFNPQGSVVRIFIVKVDCSDIPPRSRTFVRQRTFVAPEGSKLKDGNNHSWLRYLINLRLATDRSGKLYMHTDIRLLFSNKTDLDVMNLVAERGYNCNEDSKVKPGTTYELMTATEMPQKPKYSPIK